MPRTFTEDEVRESIEAAAVPLRARIAQSEAENARLEAEIARLKKDSSTSSKPPSSDIVKPPRNEVENLAKRFRDHGQYYFTFLKVPGVEPTNNAVQRGFRHLVIDRKVTQGTRGDPGRFPRRRFLCDGSGCG